MDIMYDSQKKSNNIISPRYGKDFKTGSALSIPRQAAQEF